MLIDLDVTKKLVIKNALITHMGWTPEPKWGTTVIKSPTRNVIFFNNTFENTTDLEYVTFKISYFKKIKLDTIKKLLIFGENDLFAVDVS